MAAGEKASLTKFLVASAQPVDLVYDLDLGFGLGLGFDLELDLDPEAASEPEHEPEPEPERALEPGRGRGPEPGRALAAVLEYAGVHRSAHDLQMPSSVMPCYRCSYRQVHDHSCGRKH